VIPRFVGAAGRGEPVVIYGDGTQSRDFCFIDDVVAANLLAAEAPGAAGGLFNIACGQALSLNEVLGHLETIVGHTVGRRHEPARVGDVRHSLADISSARAILGYAPATTFATGLRQTVEWFRRSPPG
jgi:UDP-glucose 4-epimerase